MQLRVAQTIPDTEAEGPGKRFALWVQGCSLRCPGCCNPEMFAPDQGGSFIEPAALAAKILATPGIEGISVLGGEPFEQPEGLAELCQLVRAGGLSVMVYTGYTLAELQAKGVARSPRAESRGLQHQRGSESDLAGRAGDESTSVPLDSARGERSPAISINPFARLLATVDLLVDGRYEQSQPESRRRWIGSSNQVMHFLTPRYSATEPRFSTPNTVELRFVKGQLTINGWPQAADAVRKP